MSKSRAITHAATTLFLLASLVTAAARSARAAEPPSETDVPVVIGATVCFVVHRPQGEMTARDRVERIHYVFARYLGAQEGNFTLHAIGKDGSAGVAIYLNGDHLITVTRDDASLTRSKSCASVAGYWKEALEKAFAETHVRPDHG